MPARFRVPSNEEAVISVGGGHSGDADAGLSKDVVDRQRHNVLWDEFLGVNLTTNFLYAFSVPLP